MKTQNCKVLRAFMMDGKSITVGKEIILPIGFATELRTVNKVEFVAEPPKVEVPKPAAIVQPTPDPLKGKESKGGK